MARMGVQKKNHIWGRGINILFFLVDEQMFLMTVCLTAEMAYVVFRTHVTHTLNKGGNSVIIRSVTLTSDQQAALWTPWKCNNFCMRGS